MVRSAQQFEDASEWVEAMANDEHTTIVQLGGHEGDGSPADPRTVQIEVMVKERARIPEPHLATVTYFSETSPRPRRRLTAPASSTVVPRDVPMAVVRFQITAQYSPALFQKAWASPATTPTLALGSVEEAKEIKRTKASYRDHDVVTCLVEVSRDKAEDWSSACSPEKGVFISIAPPPNVPRDPAVAFAEVTRAPGTNDDDYCDVAYNTALEAGTPVI